ncbi:putative short chain dehydrogenase/ reductase [Dactylonectria estremocensis]|uniref:Short chain dehydrogenase/ reductase n=1 Tax=Dactylonectria estremocensis TaxID=1079267 RepID=A0A9P9IZJ3_9HYPO|nr:putative short chain dehydrogenase/ reductase [Dactylonectria estremocensis]
MAFAGRLTIISGGIGGIGSAVGKVLRQQSAKLALLYAPFEEHQVHQALEEVYGSRDHPDIRTYACDITQPHSVEEAFAAIESDNVAPPTFLINSAGYVNLSPLEETTPEDSLKHYLINLYGPTLTGQAFARMYFRHKSKHPDIPGARIVNIASQAAHVALDHHGAYCASKAGLVGLTKSQASEWGARGIIANSVSPGPVWTALGRKAWADDKVREDYLRAVPTRDFAEPEEVAQVVSFLCQDSSRNINGTDLRLDGGYTAR